MNRKQAALLASRMDVIKAYAEGKDIQVSNNSVWVDWVDLNSPEFIGGMESTYRIKPEPREYWLCKDKQYNGYHVVSHIPIYSWDEIIHVVEKL